MRLKSKALIPLLIIMIILLLFSSTVRISISNSLVLCFRTLIPALFPYLIISSMLLDLGFDSLFSPTYSCFIMSLLFGYPIGTKIVCESYTKDSLKKETAERLLLCTANASPSFIISAIGLGLLHDQNIGLRFLLSQTLCAVTLFIIFVPRRSEKKSNYTVTLSLLPCFLNNTKKAIEQLLFICGITTVFGIFCDILKNTFYFTKYLVGFIEILHGTNEIPHHLYLLCAIIGFSGISVWIQAFQFIKSTDLGISNLIIGKIYSAIILPQIFLLLSQQKLKIKVFVIITIILTNLLTMCIMKLKGCDKYDFFKKNRKMLCLLRTRHRGPAQRTGSLPMQRYRRRRLLLQKVFVYPSKTHTASSSIKNRRIL